MLDATNDSVDGPNGLIRRALDCAVILRGQLAFLAGRVCNRSQFAASLLVNAHELVSEQGSE